MPVVGCWVPVLGKKRSKNEKREKERKNKKKKQKTKWFWNSVLATVEIYLFGVRILEILKINQNNKQKGKIFTQKKRDFTSFRKFKLSRKALRKCVLKHTNLFVLRGFPCLLHPFACLSHRFWGLSWENNPHFLRVLGAKNWTTKQMSHTVFPQDCPPICLCVFPLPYKKGPNQSTKTTLWPPTQSWDNRAEISTLSGFLLFPRFSLYFAQNQRRVREG